MTTILAAFSRSLARSLQRLAFGPLLCPVPDCDGVTLRELPLCVDHMLARRAELGDRACRAGNSDCLVAAYGRSIYCRDHFEQLELQGFIQRGHHGVVRRLAVRAPHLRPVPGLEISCHTFPEPTAATSYPEKGPTRPVVHQGFDRRLRMNLTGYIDGGFAGRLDVYLHPGGTARIRRVDTADEYQRRGVASALYETLRAEHPGLLIDHGNQLPDGRAWWLGYCRARSLDPADPSS